MTATEAERLQRAHERALWRYLNPPAILHEDGSISIMRPDQAVLAWARAR